MAGGGKEFGPWTLRSLCLCGYISIEPYFILTTGPEDADVWVRFGKSYMFRFHCCEMIRYNFVR